MNLFILLITSPNGGPVMCRWEIEELASVTKSTRCFPFYLFFVSCFHPMIHNQYSDVCSKLQKILLKCCISACKIMSNQKVLSKRSVRICTVCQLRFSNCRFGQITLNTVTKFDNNSYFSQVFIKLSLQDETLICRQ